MERPDLLFNFIGVSVADWHAAFQFFHETLGIKAGRAPQYGDWAILGGAWDAYYHAGSRSAVFELFDRGRTVTERHWGLNQGIRPGFQVSDLQATMEKYHLPFTIADCPWGKTAEFPTAEGIRFAFAEIPGAPFSDDPAVPYIGHVAIKCADFDAMQEFYTNVLGFISIETDSDYAVLAQESGHPSVILERGGTVSMFDVHGTPWENNAVRALPIFLSLMTTDIQSSDLYLRSRGVRILREILEGKSWGGTDMHIADPDGNALQVVQYR